MRISESSETTCEVNSPEMRAALSRSVKIAVSFWRGTCRCDACQPNQLEAGRNVRYPISIYHRVKQKRKFGVCKRGESTARRKGKMGKEPNVEVISPSETRSVWHEHRSRNSCQKGVCISY